MLDYDSIFIIHFINCITVGPVKQAPAIYISNMKGYLYRSSAEYRINFIYWEMCALHISLSAKLISYLNSIFNQ